MFIEKRSFKNSRSLTLAAIYEGEDKKAPTVVICHGYASSKDSVSQRDISKRLIKSGFSVYRFDFTGCGQSQGSIENLVPSVGLDDLNSAIADFGKKEFILCGTIIVHGDTDEIVSLSQSNKLIKTLGSKVKKLKIIEGGVHRLRGRPMQKAHEVIIDFFKKIC